MPIAISASMIRQLPENEQPDFEDYLRQKANGRCHLCDGQLNEAADTLVADHDVPEREGGQTTRDNLNLVHRACNSAKRNARSVDIRPLLRLQAFLRAKGQLLKYDGVLPHFGIAPKPSRLTREGDEVRIAFSDGTEMVAPVLSEVVGGRRRDFAYGELPRVAIFNDDACQPRNLKLSHVSAIYADLQRNPLHEAPGVRVSPTDADGLSRLLMFDGQHKTVASWMHGRDRVACKVYLDLAPEEAIVLVNSIQAKIKKLPLSPFELAAKMSDEWENKLLEYEEQVGTEHASEAGFIEWLPQPERTRGRQAFRLALVDDILGDAGLQFRPFEPESPGTRPFITENAFKTKVLDKLLHLTPISESGEVGVQLRAQERANVLRLINLFAQVAFQYEGTDPPPNYETKARRLSYQAALSYVFGLMRQVVGHKLRLRSPQELLKANPTDEQWREIEQGVRRIVDHPIWTADLTRSNRLRAVDNALTKNQNIVEAFEAIGLDAGYVDGLSEWSSSDFQD